MRVLPTAQKHVEKMTAWISAVVWTDQLLWVAAETVMDPAVGHRSFLLAQIAVVVEAEVVGLEERAAGHLTL